MHKRSQQCGHVLCSLCTDLRCHQIDCVLIHPLLSTLAQHFIYRTVAAKIELLMLIVCLYLVERCTQNAGSLDG
jgi:hypothetical protein